jgi:hypothetical protein
MPASYVSSSTADGWRLVLRIRKNGFCIGVNLLWKAQDYYSTIGIGPAA